MTDFKHITVTAAEEDDEVIVAGVREEAAELEPAQAAEPEPESEPVPEPEPKPEPKPTPAPAPKPAARARDGYHETTLEDLESSSMPLIQKIVIIAAVVCIIGAIAYYLVAMR